MQQRERDIEQLAVIQDYCERIFATLEYFGDDYELFDTVQPFQDSCALCLIQIGESTKRLSDAFKSEHPQIQWSKMYGMRNHLVHGYHMFDTEIAWDAIKNYVPELQIFCSELLADS